MHYYKNLQYQNLEMVTKITPNNFTNTIYLLRFINDDEFFIYLLKKKK